jgi:hypothetical protein
MTDDIVTKIGLYCTIHGWMPEVCCSYQQSEDESNKTFKTLALLLIQAKKENRL